METTSNGQSGGGRAVVGLSNLMEAATALAGLTASPAPPQKPAANNTKANTSANPRAMLISDEDNDERQRAAAATKEIFPERLLLILDDTSLSDVVSWLPHGRSFVILRPDVFTEKVLPKYLPPVDARAPTKYASFTRKLNRWGFRQATRGPDLGAFHHPLFRRDKPELCKEMVCHRAGKRASGSRLPAKKRQITHLLTKESLDIMNSATTAQFNKQIAPATTAASAAARSPPTKPAAVSEDSQSMQSELPTTAYSLKNKVTVDPELAQRARERRNAEERMRVAKAMLYHSYLEAVQQKDSDGANH